MNAVLKSAAIVLVIAALAALAYLMGAQSVQPELRAERDRADKLDTEAKQHEQELAEIEQELFNTDRERADAETRLASCDGDRATEIFEDLLAIQSSFLDQYNAYLGNDDLVFLFDWDTTDRHMQGYSGRNSMVDQFAKALESCTDGPGANA